ncbi:RodZ domain-containing protein [Viridibacterium curvum]|uniref:HTH cro/C1-type domain-containing protein n=1 Tax=Viridibacterium curvum TaxID=1101404 RepID=A0ABP9R254_9RHOO
MSEEQQVSESVASAEDSSAPTSPTSLWVALREAREARGLTVMDVAQHLKLTPRQIEAIEAGDMAQLPGPAFVKGFVRNYARFLNLDITPFTALTTLQREEPASGFEAMPLGSMPAPGGWKFSPLPALGIAAVLLGLAVAGWHYSWFEQRDEQYIAEWMAQSEAMLAGRSAPASELLQAAPEVIVAAGSEPTSAPQAASEPAVSAPLAMSAPAAVSAPVAMSTPAAASAAAAVPVKASAPVASPVPKASAPVAEKAPVAASQPAAQPAPKAAEGASRLLRFSFKGESWVEIRDGSGIVIFSRVNPAGSTQEVRGMPPIDLVVGNAAQVELNQDGKPVALKVATGSTVARMRLP